MPDLFAYGTLRRSDIQDELFGRQVEMTAGILSGFAIRPLTVDGETHRLAVPDPDGSIRGMVLDLSDAEIAICDSYEPPDYRREEVTLLDGRTAWAYVAAN